MSTLLFLILPLASDVMNPLLVPLIILVVGIPTALLILRAKDNDFENELKDVLELLEDFTPTEVVQEDQNSNNFYYFAIDDTSKKVFYFIKGEKWLFNYCNIISASLRYGNEEIVTKRSALGTIGGAVIGDAFAGSVGAIIGGATASSSSKKKVSSICVHIILRDMEDSQDSSLDVFVSKNEMTTGDFLFERYNSKAQKIMDLLTRAIDYTERSYRQSGENKETLKEDNILMDNLKELIRMKEQGLLSEDDYTKAKNKLLA